MKHFDENFSTDDFDEEMMDFIESNFDISNHPDDWCISSPFLKYNSNMNLFWVGETIPDNILTKEQFKEKISMVEKEQNIFTKANLKDGMLIEVRTPMDKAGLYMVMGDYLATNTGHNELSIYEEDLTCVTGDSGWDIIKVYTVSSFNTLELSLLKKELIWQRKSPVQLEIAKLEDEKCTLQKRIDELKENL